MGGEAWRTPDAGPHAPTRSSHGTSSPTTPSPTRLIGIRDEDEPPGRARARRRHAGAGVPDVRDRAAGRIAARRSTDHQVRTSELWARFSDVAAANPYAWVRDAKSAEEIRTPSPNNRMIGIAVPEAHELEQRRRHVSRTDHVLGREGARRSASAKTGGCSSMPAPMPTTTTSCRTAPTFTRLPRSASAGRGRSARRAGADDFAFVDLYSCFPSAVQIGAPSLGLGPRSPADAHRRAVLRRRSWNNYVMHAIATVVQRLRDAPGRLRACVSANGGYVTKHAFGVYSTTPPAGGFQHGAAARRSRRASATRARRRLAGRRRDRGIHGDARPRGRARDRVRRVPPRGWETHMGRGSRSWRRGVARRR